MGGRQSSSQQTEGGGGHVIVTVDPMQKSKTSPTEARIDGLTRLITEESKRRKDAERDEYDIHKDNMLLLKQLYKKMDPSIMKTSTTVTHGQVQLSLKYIPGEQILLIKVMTARGLVAKDLRGKSSDPYVLMRLHPDTSDLVMRTQAVKRSLSPVYNEIFTVPITPQQLRETQLIVQVWDEDVLSNDDLIGEALVPLGKFDFKLESVHTAWCSLHADTDLDISGELEISLAYKAPQTLLVSLHAGHELTNRYSDEGEAPNVFVKMAVPGLALVHKTKVKKNTVNPEWSETFEIEIPPEELSLRYIVFHCIDYQRFGSNDSLGQVIIDLHTFSPEVGLSGRFKLADLKNSDRLRARWFQDATIQEFREGVIAHAALRCPGLVFTQHHGSQMLRVHSKKAGAQAQLRVINGIPVY